MVVVPIVVIVVVVVVVVHVVHAVVLVVVIIPNDTVVFLFRSDGHQFEQREIQSEQIVRHDTKNLAKSQIKKLMHYL